MNSTSVIFDVGAVLVDWDPRYLFRQLLADDAAIEAFFEEVGFHAWNRSLDGGRVWSEAVADLSARFPHRGALIAAAHERWHEMLPGQIDGSVEILERLAAAGTPLYAITNFSSEKWAETRRRFGFFNVFRDIVVSGDEKLLKPEPEIYRCCLERNGLDARTCVFIDDSMPNVDGAAALGIDAILFQSPEQLEAALAQRGLLS